MKTPGPSILYKTHFENGGFDCIFGSMNTLLESAVGNVSSGKDRLFVIRLAEETALCSIRFGSLLMRCWECLGFGSGFWRVFAVYGLVLLPVSVHVGLRLVLVCLFAKMSVLLFPFHT